MSDRSREQKLIDIMFEIAMKSAQSMHGKSNLEIANWVANTLDSCGFPTQLCGASWGVLIRPKDPALDIT